MLEYKTMFSKQVFYKLLKTSAGLLNSQFFGISLVLHEIRKIVFREFLNLWVTIKGLCMLKCLLATAIHIHEIIKASTNP